MKITKTTPTIMKVLASSSVTPGGVKGEVGVEVKSVVKMLRGEGVAEGAVVVVETTASPGGEEGGDGGSPSIRVDEEIVAVAVVVYIHTKKLKQITDGVTIHHLPILRLIIGAELATSLRACKSLGSGDISKLQTLGDMLRAYCGFMSSLGRSSL